MGYSEIVQNQIMLRLGAKMNFNQIAKELKLSRSGVKYFAAKLYETSSTKRRSGSGRDRKHNEDVQKSIVDYFKEHEKNTYNECIQDLKINCNKSFVSRVLKQNGVRAYVSVKKSFLTEDHITQRKTLAENTKGWSMSDWTKVVFTDEKTFMSRPNGRVMVKRTRGAAFEQRHLDIVPARKFSINVWGCMVGANSTFRVYHIDKKFNSRLYRYHLRKVIFPKLARKYGNDSFIYQQDNAPIHTSKLMKTFFSEVNIIPMFWPACSPDLSPIENLWAILQKRVNKRLRSQSANNDTELFEIVREEAKNIEPKIVQNLYKTMQKRIKLLEDNQHKRIKY